MEADPEVWKPSDQDLDRSDLLLELEPVVEGELNRHTGIAKEWFPHEYVPWSEGRNYDGLLNGDRWQESDSRVSEVARSALIVNLLTEDNLPSYHHEIALLFGRDGAWGDWVHRWTAEEGRHGIAMRDWRASRRCGRRDRRMAEGATTAATTTAGGELINITRYGRRPARMSRAVDAVAPCLRRLLWRA